MRRRVFTDEDIKKFNMLRQENVNRSFTFSEMTTFLKNNGFKGSEILVRKFSKGGIIVRVKKGVFRFPEKPVYYKLFQQCLDKPLKKIEEKPLDEIQEAITLLSNNGFKVLKKVFDIDRALLSPDKTVSDFIRWEEV